MRLRISFERYRSRCDAVFLMFTLKLFPFRFQLSIVNLMLPWNGTAS
jgi:hypothetical protein